MQEYEETQRWLAIPTSILTCFQPLTLGRYGSNCKSAIFKPMARIKFLSTSCEIALRWITQKTLIITQQRFKQWLGAIRHQAIGWANVDPDLCRHMTSLGYNELTYQMAVDITILTHQGLVIQMCNGIVSLMVLVMVCWPINWTNANL